MKINNTSEKYKDKYKTKWRKSYLNKYCYFKNTNCDLGFKKIIRYIAHVTKNSDNKFYPTILNQQYGKINVYTQIGQGFNTFEKAFKSLKQIIKKQNKNL